MADAKRPVQTLEVLRQEFIAAVLRCKSYEALQEAREAFLSKAAEEVKGTRPDEDRWAVVLPLSDRMNLPTWRVKETG